MNKIQEIREKCIEVNPEIVELKFGCEVEMFGLGRTPISGENDGTWLVMNRNGVTYPLLSDHKIIGRPIRLADVLLVIPELWVQPTMLVEGNFRWLGYKINSSGVKWKLDDDNLEHQSPETIDFIHELLTK